MLERVLTGLDTKIDARYAAVRNSINDINELVEDIEGLQVEFNAITGDITFTRADNTTLVINIYKGDLVTSVVFDSVSDSIVVTDRAGNVSSIPVADIFAPYSGTTGTHIKTTVSNNEIGATLIAGSITEDELSDTLVVATREGLQPLYDKLTDEGFIV